MQLNELVVMLLACEEEVGGSIKCYKGSVLFVGTFDYRFIFSSSEEEFHTDLCQQCYVWT